MNTVAKLLLAMRGNPLDWQLSQLQTVARQKGIAWRHDGTSHPKNVSYPVAAGPISIGAGGPTPTIRSQM